MRRDLGCCCRKDLAQIRQGEAGIENVFDHEDVLAFDGLVEILDHLDGAGRALAFAVAGDGDEIECGVGLNGARQIDEEKRRALEHADHDQLFAVEIAGDLCSHLGHAVGDLLAGVKDFESLKGRGGHGDSIARIPSGITCVNPVAIAGRTVTNRNVYGIARLYW